MARDLVCKNDGSRKFLLFENGDGWMYADCAQCQARMGGLYWSEFVESDQAAYAPMQDRNLEIVRLPPAGDPFALKSGYTIGCDERGYWYEQPGHARVYYYAAGQPVA